MSTYPILDPAWLKRELLFIPVAVVVLFILWVKLSGSSQSGEDKVRTDLAHGKLSQMNYFEVLYFKKGCNKNLCYFVMVP